MRYSIQLLISTCLVALLASTASATPRRRPLAKPTIDATAVLVQYQRVGRDLIKLHDLRGPDVTAPLWSRFRAIKLDETRTIEARVTAAAVLGELHALIERLKGVQVSTECMQSPLADGCR